MAPTIAIHHATLTYQDHTIFRDVNFTLASHCWTALLGSSGVGKSSLLKFIAHLPINDCSFSGSVIADNRLPVADQVAYMGQSDALLPWLNVIDNVCLGNKLRTSSQRNKNDTYGKAKDLLIEMGLGKALNHYPHQLSGGMRQRVALARTIIENKSVILMDEPFSALDAITRYQLQALAAKLFINKTVLFITHDPAEAARLAHHIYLLNGHPATIKYIANISTATPRELDDPSVINLQARLLRELAGLPTSQNEYVSCTIKSTKALNVVTATTATTELSI